MKIRPFGAEYFHADGQTGRHCEAHCRFSQFARVANNLRHTVVKTHSETFSSYVAQVHNCSICYSTYTKTKKDFVPNTLQ